MSGLVFLRAKQMSVSVQLYIGELGTNLGLKLLRQVIYIMIFELRGCKQMASEARWVI